jgi:ATP-binding cassette, subfamily B, heavy metal transporter
LINFETVKFFTAEDYERRRFGESVEKFQSGSVAVQASLSFLNISQQLILQLCLATALSLSALGIKQRLDCCIAHGCEAGVSDCCQAIDNKTCPGMAVGDFVSVLSYTIQLFGPLNFLGSVYNTIVMSVIDLGNLSELLAQHPDVVDAPDAIPLPLTNEDDEDIAVEFKDVYFHYPTQSATSVIHYEERYNDGHRRSDWGGKDHDLASLLPVLRRARWSRQSERKRRPHCDSKIAARQHRSRPPNGEHVQ